MKPKVRRPNGIVNGFHYEPGDEVETLLVHCGQQWASPSFKIDWHHHEHWEFYFQATGRTVWQLEDQDPIEINENELFLVAPHVRHRLVSGDQNEYEFYYVCFEIERAILTANELDSIWAPGINPKVTGAERIIPALQRLMQEALTLRRFHNRAIDQTLSQLLLEASRLLIAEESVHFGAALHPIVVSIREKILSDPGRAWSLEMFAEMHNRSPKYLSNLFKKQMNEGLQRFLTRQRITLACQLLRETRDPITDIAFQAGFSSSQHLATAFRKIRNQSPRAYRLSCDQ